MHTDADCIFCKIVAGEIPSFKVYEDEVTLAFMDINPANEGHCLVVPKEHSRDLYVIPEGSLGAVVVTASRVARQTVRDTEPQRERDAAAYRADFRDDSRGHVGVAVLRR